MKAAGAGITAPSGRRAAAPPAPPSPAERRRLPAWSTHPALVVLVIAAVGVVHVMVVSGRYHVGSFDDDSAYVYMARSIVGGTGLFGHMANGFPLVSDYPPGYPYLLAPVVWVFGTGHGFWAERALSVACFTAVFPLTWAFLRQRGVSASTVYVTLALLAVNPVLATYGSMVMAECPFVVLFLLLAMAAERWGAAARPAVLAGVATVVLAAGAVAVKEAGLAMAGGVVLWLGWRRRWGRAALAAAGVCLLLAPILAARLAASVPLAGARYSSEIGGYLGGGILHDLAVVPMGIAQFVFYALYAAVVPVDSPFSNNLGVLIVFGGLASASAAVFCTVGAVTWWRRRGADVVLVMIAAYFLECVVYRYVNERRVVLFLPVAVAWYVMGARVTGRWVLERARRRSAPVPRLRKGMAAVAVAGVAGLLVQFPVDYRVSLGHDTSEPGGSPYMALLRRLGPPSSVVENDFGWTTALYSGHPAAASAFQATYTDCSATRALAGMRQDHAAYGFTAALNGKFVDDACLAALAATQPWAVELLHTAWDDATVIEVVGRGTGHPDLHKLAWEGSARAFPEGGRAVARWSLPPGSSVTQVSVGAAASQRGPTRDVYVSLRTPRGWERVAAHAGAVGPGGAPFLLAELPRGVTADQVEVTVVGGGAARLADVAVIGRRS